MIRYGDSLTASAEYFIPEPHGSPLAFIALQEEALGQQFNSASYAYSLLYEHPDSRGPGHCKSALEQAPRGGPVLGLHAAKMNEDILRPWSYILRRYCVFRPNL